MGALENIRVLYEAYQNKKFPQYIKTYNAAPESHDKHIMLALPYAEGCINSFLKDGQLDEQRRSILVSAKAKIQSSLDIEDPEAREYLELANATCAAVLDALGPLSEQE